MEDEFFEKLEKAGSVISPRPDGTLNMFQGLRSIEILNFEMANGNWLQRPRSDNTVYHYTNVDGLKGIVQSGDFHLTDFKHFDDESEFKYGLDLVRGVVDDALSLPPVRDDLIVLSALEKLRDWFADEDWFDDREIFIGCLSEDADCLDLWKTDFGDFHRGVAIGIEYDFDGPFVSAGLLPGLYKVIYDPPKQTAIIQDAIRIFIQNLGLYSQYPERMLASDHYPSFRNLKSVDDVARWSVDVLATALITRCIYFKDPRFSSEGEVRFQTQPNGRAPFKIFEMNGKRKTSIGKVNKARNRISELRIPSVTLGRRFPERQVKHLREFLDKNGFADTKLVPSSIPIRRQ